MKISIYLIEMIVRKEKLSPTTSDVNLDCFDSDLSWLQMLPSTIKISQNQSDSQRTKEDKILTWILTRHPIVFDDLSNDQRAEEQLHESRKNNQKLYLMIQRDQHPQLRNYEDIANVNVQDIAITQAKIY